MFKILNSLFQKFLFRKFVLVSDSEFRASDLLDATVTLLLVHNRN